jgi:ubiquitin-like protein ATG12
MSQLPSPSPSPGQERIAVEEEENEGVEAEAPLTMAASVVLTHLPRDASKALEMAGVLGVEKGESF